MVFRFYVKLTASRKTEQSDGKTKNIPQIQGFRMRYSKSNSSLPGLTITESLRRTSRVYRGHIGFPPGGGEVLSYMGYIGMCRCEGYGFQAVYSRIGYINQSVWV